MPDNASFNHETVALDGEAFSGCEFRACRLVYAGGEPPKFDGCRFEDCDWKLEGPAFDWFFHGSPHVHTWVNIARKAPQA